MHLVRGGIAIRMSSGGTAVLPSIVEEPGQTALEEGLSQEGGIRFSHLQTLPSNPHDKPFFLLQAIWVKYNGELPSPVLDIIQNLVPAWNRALRDGDHKRITQLSSDWLDRQRSEALAKANIIMPSFFLRWARSLRQDKVTRMEDASRESAREWIMIYFGPTSLLIREENVVVVARQLRSALGVAPTHLSQLPEDFLCQWLRAKGRASELTAVATFAIIEPDTGNDIGKLRLALPVVGALVEPHVSGGIPQFWFRRKEGTLFAMLRPQVLAYKTETRFIAERRDWYEARTWALNVKYRSTQRERFTGEVFFLGKGFKSDHSSSSQGYEAVWFEQNGRASELKLIQKTPENVARAKIMNQGREIKQHFDALHGDSFRLSTKELFGTMGRVQTFLNQHEMGDFL